MVRDRFVTVHNNYDNDSNVYDQYQISVSMWYFFWACSQDGN